MTERLYLEDLQVGQRFACGRHALDAAQIKAFAREYDPQPFHLDEDAARDTFFGGLAASGWHVVCLSMRMIAEHVPFAGGLIGGAAEITWPQPTRPTDVLEVVSIVMAVTPSRSKPERGTALLRTETRNQKGELLQVFTAKCVVPRRPKAVSSGPTEEAQMRLRMLVTLLVATGCAQPDKVTANNCDVVPYQSVSGGAGYTSGINYPRGQYRDFVDLVLVQDHWLIKQRNWEEATATQQYCRIHVLFSKSPAELARLDEAARGWRSLCGNEYASILDKVRATWQPGELQAETARTCGSA